MEKFSIIIDQKLKENLCKICRLCGIDNSEMIPVLSTGNSANLNEPELSDRIQQLIGLFITGDDQMPQSICLLCCDKINDFHNFREMCYATDKQTRKLLGLKAPPGPPTDNSKENSKSLEMCRDAEELTDSGNAVDITINRKRRINGQEEDNHPATIDPSGRKDIDTSNKKICTTPRVSLPLISGRGRRRHRKNKNYRNMVLRNDFWYYGHKDEDESNEIKQQTNRMPSTRIKLRSTCNICQEVFSSKTKLEAHTRTSHLPKVERYVCTACDQIFYKGYDIKNHQLWHKLSKTPYQCALCGDLLLTTYGYTRHLRDHNTSVLYLSPPILVLDKKCPRCHIVFVTRFLFNTHSCVVSTKHCIGCDRKFNTENAYLLHAAKCDGVYHIHNECVLPEISTIDTVPDQTKEDKLIKHQRHHHNHLSHERINRIDKLLKSTLDALISIKYEHGLQAMTTLNAGEEEVKNSNEFDYNYGQHNGRPSDYDHEDDNFTEEEVNGPLRNPTIVKEEITIEENEDDVGTDEVKILNEPDVENVDQTLPRLRLKICREDGRLNASLVEHSSTRINSATMHENGECRKRKKHGIRDTDVDHVLASVTSMISCKKEPNVMDTFNASRSCNLDSGVNTLIPLCHLKTQHDTTFTAGSEMKSEDLEEKNASPLNNERIKDESWKTISCGNGYEEEKPDRNALDMMLRVTNICDGVSDKVRNNDDKNPKNIISQLQISCVQGGFELPEEVKMEREEQHYSQSSEEDETDFKYYSSNKEGKISNNVKMLNFELVERIKKEEPSVVRGVDDDDDFHDGVKLESMEEGTECTMNHKIDETTIEVANYYNERIKQGNDSMMYTEIPLTSFKREVDEDQYEKFDCIVTTSGFIEVAKEASSETRPFSLKRKSTEEIEEQDGGEDDSDDGNADEDAAMHHMISENEHSLEEKQNQLNHEVQEQQQQQQSLASENEEESYTSAVASCSQEPEEAENIRNESQGTTFNNRRGGPSIPLNASLNLTAGQFQLDNINEIAENNNNANIERELFDDVQQLHQEQTTDEGCTALPTRDDNCT